MAELRWTAQAADDLESITEFIARDSAHYAQLFTMDILEATERLAEFPRSGRIVPELNRPSIREVIVGRYRVVYRCTEQLVEILTVYHGARLLDLRLLS